MTSSYGRRCLGRSSFASSSPTRFPASVRSSGRTGSPFLMVFLFVGTIFSTLASANGCINDASRAWFSMGRDRYMPVWFGAVHPHYRTPFRSRKDRVH